MNFIDELSRVASLTVPEKILDLWGAIAHDAGVEVSELEDTQTYFGARTDDVIWAEAYAKLIKQCQTAGIDIVSIPSRDILDTWLKIRHQEKKALGDEKKLADKKAKEIRKKVSAVILPVFHACESEITSIVEEEAIWYPIEDDKPLEVQILEKLRSIMWTMTSPLLGDEFVLIFRHPRTKELCGITAEAMKKLCGGVDGEIEYAEFCRTQRLA